MKFSANLSKQETTIISVSIFLILKFFIFVGKSVAIQKKGQQRSYIDIDVTDPFKVPKASEYIDQPLPKYDPYGNKKGDENDHSISYKFDNVKVQAENKVDVDEGPNHNDDEHYKDEEYNSGPYGRRFHNSMEDDGPEVPADQEESPRELEPESYHSHDEDEHMAGDSRHYVPKADWKPDDIEPMSDQRNHEDSGASWRSDDGPPHEGSEDYRRRDYGERKFERNEEDRGEGDHGREHGGGWERRGEDNDAGQQFGPHFGPHDGQQDGPHEESHESAQNEERRNEGPEESSRENGREGEYFDRDSRDN